MSSNESRFHDVTDPDSLTPEEREEYFDYWASRTPNERLAHVMRLNRAKWGDEVFDRGMDKTYMEFWNADDKEPYLILTRKSDAPGEPWVKTELRRQTPSE